MPELKKNSIHTITIDRYASDGQGTQLVARASAGWTAWRCSSGGRCGERPVRSR